jgi:hypothetical protein
LNLSADQQSNRITEAAYGVNCYEQKKSLRASQFSDGSARENIIRGLDVVRVRGSGLGPDLQFRKHERNYDQ